MIHLSENLKALRKQTSVTQEQLADVLCVSPQAISRWESGATYPDITMLPTIANFFEVTLDDLMGMENIRDESDLNKILDEYRKNGSKGLVAENIQLLREALRRYPNNYDLLRKLVRELNWEQVPDEDHRRNLKEAIEISKRILRNCSDNEIKNDISVTLCYMYNEIGETDKAIKLAESFPSIWETSTAILYRLYSGEKQLEQCQWNIVTSAEMMYWAMYEMSDLNYHRSDLTTADRIRIMQKSLSLYELIYDEGDQLIQNERLSKIHRYIGSMEILEGNYASAIEHLEKSADYAIKYDTLPDTAMHTSLLVNRIRYNKAETQKNYTSNECSQLYEKLQTDRYDVIRNDERFIAILERIKQYI